MTFSKLMSRTGMDLGVRYVLSSIQCGTTVGMTVFLFLETSSVRYRNYRKPQTEQLRYTGSKASVVRQDQQNLYKEDIKSECHGISPEGS